MRKFSHTLMKDSNQYCHVNDRVRTRLEKAWKALKINIASSRPWKALNFNSKSWKALKTYILFKKIKNVVENSQTVYHVCGLREKNVCRRLHDRLVIDHLVWMETNSRIWAIIEDFAVCFWYWSSLVPNNGFYSFLSV